MNLRREIYTIMIEIQAGFDMAVAMGAQVAPIAVLFAVCSRLLSFFIAMVKGRSNF